jgi:hypothetical protein
MEKKKKEKDGEAIKKTMHVLPLGKRRYKQGLNLNFLKFDWIIS